MNAIMMSMTREDVKLIASWRKRAVITKKCPKVTDPPFRIYIYESRGNLKHLSNIAYTEYRYEGRGMVVGDCICHRIRSSDDPCVSDHLKLIRVSAREYSDYFGGKQGYVFYLSDVKMYDKPFPIEMFGKSTPPTPWYHVDEDERRNR